MAIGEMPPNTDKTKEPVFPALFHGFYGLLSVLDQEI